LASNSEEPTTKRRRLAPPDHSPSLPPPTDTTSCAPSSINKSGFKREEYTVGWLCALPIELAASQTMLDEEHPDLLQDEKDSNTYTLGRIGQHNVALACLPSGTMGTNAASIAAANLVRSFPNIRFGLMVGVGGGAPGNPSDDSQEDLRLGDVVVSKPESDYGMGDLNLVCESKLTEFTGGVVQYDFGKTIEKGKFIQTGSLNKPPTVLRSGVSKLQAKHERVGSAISQYVSEMVVSKSRIQKFQYQGSEHDKLFEADYDHNGSGKACEDCDKGRLLLRDSRDTNDPVIHYGLIGSANQVMRHGATREKLRQEKGILCFEMEAAGLMDNFPCLIIRGICDYSDTHKNKRWQPYAAATAAAYAKELLEIIPAAQVTSTKEAAKIVDLS
jgi:nucleoside phosphorylase